MTTKITLTYGDAERMSLLLQRICEVCGKNFSTDSRGRRESDWIKCDRYCDMTCNLAAVDIDEGRSIRWAVLNDSVDVASRRVRDVFSLHEFKAALAEQAVADVTKHYRQFRVIPLLEDMAQEVVEAN